MIINVIVYFLCVLIGFLVIIGIYSLICLIYNLWKDGYELTDEYDGFSTADDVEYYYHKLRVKIENLKNDIMEE
jgi:hypothetical protein